MHMKKYIYVIELLLGGLLASCGSVDVLTYDQLHPAELSFPAEIRQVGVVNNMAHREVPMNDLILGVVQGEGPAVTEALAGALADSKYFDQVVICDSALQAKDADVTVDPMLSIERVNQLTSDLGVDMLVSMEGMWVETAKKQVEYPGLNALIPVVQATVTPVLRLYLPNRSQPMSTLTLPDSIYWDLGSAISEKVILKEANRIVANKIADCLVPSWKPVERVYFCGGCVEMRDAAVYLHEGSWQESQDLWKELYNRLRKGKTKAKAAYNIALSYEMLGNLDEALVWVKKSAEFVAPQSEEEKLIQYYTAALNRRIQEMVSLKSQMSRFNDNF